MGSGDDKRHSRSTARFDSEQLAKLTREVHGEAAEATSSTSAEDVEAASSELLPATSRAATVHDPMTMALLAEVARNSKTVDFTPEQVAKLIEDAQQAEPPPSHTNVQRRKP